MRISDWSLDVCSSDRIEHRLRVAGNLDLAPGPRDAALRVDQEGAALDAHDLAPVHVLLVDHVEGAAQRLVGVADQVEAEALLRAEVLVRPDRVARHAQHGRAELAELGQQRVEVAAFGGASGVGVLRVEVQHQPLAAAVASSEEHTSELQSLMRISYA